jgi:hypothetical protein
MIQLTKLRDLTPLSAASGLVRVAESFYIVADDELHLSKFPIDGDEPGTLLRMLPGELPSDPKARKRAKPDFEALTRLPPFGAYAHGALLALGSGSTAKRHRGVLLPLRATGAVDTNGIRVLDLSVLHAAIAREVGTVNVEGAVATADRLALFQRGNKGRGVNAIVAFDLKAICASIGRGDAIADTGIADLHRYDLGGIGDVPFSFSDAAALPNGSIIFAAIAENTKDAYADGPCAGAALGIVDPSGELRTLTRIETYAKVEGIHAESDGDVAQLWLVTDADNAQIPATLYRAELPLGSR